MDHDQVESDQGDGTEIQDGIQTRNDDRLALLGEISRRAEAEASKDDPDFQPDDGDDSVAHDDVAHDDSRNDSISGNQKTVVKSQQTHKIKVNGVEKELSLDEIVALAQKAEAAEEKFRQAAQLRKEVDQAQLPREDVRHGPTDDDLALARALQVGSEEEAAAAIAKVRSLPVNSDEQTLKVLDRLNFQQAIEWFRSEHKDIFADEDLTSIANSMDERMRAAGDRRPYKERYREIGEKISSKFGLSKSFESKQDRKASTAVRVPQASARARQTVEDETEESPSDVIAQIAKRRGQNLGA